MVGRETSKWSASSPAVIGRSRNSSSTRRRVGSASALKTLFISRYLANHRNRVKRGPAALIFRAGTFAALRCAEPSSPADAGEEDRASPAPGGGAEARAESRDSGSLLARG